MSVAQQRHEHGPASPSPLPTDLSEDADLEMSDDSDHGPMETRSALSEPSSAADSAAHAPATDELEADLRDGSSEDETDEKKDKEEDGEEDEKGLHAVYAALAATVVSMRQRQQEQHHLHQLTISKLEAVAQTCVGQREQLDRLNRTISQLRDQNRSLGQENDTLRHRMADLESELARNEVAVHAMSSAVSGLEGWINNSPGTVNRSSQSAAQTPTPRKGRLVVRGQGRFRGRYFVDDPNGDIVLAGAAQTAASPDSRELHDGVKSWLKGFRDVEEELQIPSPPPVVRTALDKETRSEMALTDDHDDDDDDDDDEHDDDEHDDDEHDEHDRYGDDQIDWGEFETASAT